ncbi:MAG: peptidoglycan-binding protein, partial [Acidimicrobiales bacterium]|nr:peptidoglycan-binding protein [Acidimicrobiales bacterium]
MGLLVGRSIESPADAALGAKAPPSGPITVPVERRVLSADLRIRGTLGATDSTEVTLAPSTIGSPDNVVVRAPAQGDTVNEGDVILVVGNRPVIALVGDLPMYRDLGPGDLGDDVRLIEEALGRLGYFTMTADDTYDADTAAAVEKLYQGRGFAPIGAPAEVTEEIGRLTGEVDAAAKERDVAALRRAQASLKAARAKAGARLPANEVVLAPRLPARVAKAAVKRGSRIDGAVMTLGSEVAQIRSSVAEADRTLVKPKQIA